jgi:hypothetical protein
VVSVTDAHGHILKFYKPQPLLFLSSSSSIGAHDAEWTPFQTHYFSEALVAPGIEPGTSGSVARNSNQTTEAVKKLRIGR